MDQLFSLVPQAATRHVHFREIESCIALSETRRTTLAVLWGADQAPLSVAKGVAQGVLPERSAKLSQGSPRAER
jgi:hypothetical protein